MGYYYYGTEIVMQEKMYKEYMAVLEMKSDIMMKPYEVRKTDTDDYILEFEEMKHYELHTQVLNDIAMNHEEEAEYAWKLLTAGESESDYIMEYGGGLENDVYVYEDFCWVINEPKNFATAEYIDF